MPVEQQSLGLLEADEAIKRISFREINRLFVNLAFAKIVERCADQTPFTSDDIWAMIDTVPDDAEPRAMGSAFRQAQAKGLIEATGEYVTSTQRHNHGRPVRRWRAKRI